MVLGRTRRFLLLLSFALAAGCGGAVFSGSGQAEKPGVVVLDVKGKRGAKARAAIVELLQESEHRLIAKKQYMDTARKLRATKLRAKHIREVSAELGASAVIAGRVKGRFLYVNVYDGSSGKRVERFRIRLTRRRALTKNGSRRLESRLTAALGEVKPPAEREDVVAGEDERQKSDEKEAKAEAEREKKAEAEREKAEAERKKKAEAERKKAEREREAAVVEEIADPETTDSGQVIDEEEPPGM